MIFRPCFFDTIVSCSEKGDTKTRVSALQKLIFMILNGEKFPPSMLMTIIRYILPDQDHQLKKMLLIFWEIVPKRGPDGKLLHEMILVCDAYRKDLQHPNEFIRGSTLRFLCKLKEPELLEPLMPSIRLCLEHRHSYVRRNAVLAIFKIFINFEHLIPDAPEVVLDFLAKETDASCKRNAFLMLIHLDQRKALDYLNSCLDQITSFNDILQLVIVELIYKVCIANPSERSRFIRAIYSLLNSSTSASVRYESAATLITLSQAPNALKAAANVFIDICLKESDNNVKLIVLDRLVALRESPAADKVLQDLVMDILRVLSVASDLEVKQKILNLSLDLVSNRNVEEMAQVLRKEVNKTMNESITSTDETCKYRQMLVGTLHSICIEHPDILTNDELLPTLLRLLAFEDEPTALTIIGFAREFIMKNPNLKPLIFTKILQAVPAVRNVKVHRGLLWILGEFCEKGDEQQIRDTMSAIKSCLGDIPIVESELRKREIQTDDDVTFVSGGGGSSGAQLVTADGSYATQSALSVSSTRPVDKKNIPPIRSYLLSGDFFVSASLANCLVKLALKLKDVASPSSFNSFVAECMLILTSTLHLGKSRSGLVENDASINEDDFERVALCLQILSNMNGSSPEIIRLMEDIFSSETKKALEAMIDSTRQDQESTKEELKGREVDPDDHLNFGQLMSRDQEMFENQFEISLSQAIKGNMVATATSSTFGKVLTIGDILSSSKLSKVTQLTGFSDPVYAECYVNVNQFDICLDVLIVNQTSDVLQNCTLEFSTLGDLKLVEKPSAIVLAPHDFANIKASVKVASTENGIIFGNIGKSNT